VQNKCQPNSFWVYWTLVYSSITPLLNNLLLPSTVQPTPQWVIIVVGTLYNNMEQRYNSTWVHYLADALESSVQFGRFLHNLVKRHVTVGRNVDGPFFRDVAANP